MFAACTRFVAVDSGLTPVLGLCPHEFLRGLFYERRGGVLFFLSFAVHKLNNNPFRTAVYISLNLTVLPSGLSQRQECGPDADNELRPCSLIIGVFS